MLLLLIVAFAVLLAVGLYCGFAAIRWAVAAFLIAAAMALIPVLSTTLDATDRCLDHGGRWDEAAEVCER